MSKIFGALLREHRNRCYDSYHHSGQLTQGKIVEELSYLSSEDKLLDVAVYSRWETGKSTIDHTKRAILLGLIKIFVKFDGLNSLDEADHLLETGGYSRLKPEEIEQLNLEGHDDLPSQPHSKKPLLNGIPSLPPLLEPFPVGTGIRDPRQFFGREGMLSEIFRGLRKPQFHNVLVIGRLRSGKSSLLNQITMLANCAPIIKSELRSEQKKFLATHQAQYYCVQINFKSTRLQKEEQILKYLLKKLGLSCPTPYNRDTYFEILEDDIQSPTVILMDELNEALSSPHLDKLFWDDMRYLAEKHSDRLGFIIASHNSPSMLASATVKSSPFWNIFRTEELLPLTHDEAKAMINSSPNPFNTADSSWILEKSQRWPILIATLCNARLRALREGVIDQRWQQQGLKEIASPLYRNLLQSSE